MVKLFSGSANPSLTQEVAKILKLPISKSEVIRFDDSEVRVRIEEDVRNKVCVVLQPTANPTDTNLMELFFFCDALKRQEAKKVIGFLPYFGYARQDLQHRDGECISANVVIRFLESIGFFKIYTIDLHDEATSGVFKIPFKSVISLPIIAEQIKKYLSSDISYKNVSVVSPDQGGLERARKFGEFFFNDTDFPLVVIEKKRNLNITHQSKALELFGDVKDKTAIIVDDIITSGGTLVNAADLCLEAGAKKVLAAVIHHDFSSNAVQRIQNSHLEKIFTTNTIKLKKEQHFPKLKEISVASLIAKELSH